MIKQTEIKRQCSVIEGNVTLSAAFYEDDRTGLKTPCMVEGCDSLERCKIHSESGDNWARCPYVGREARRR